MNLTTINNAVRTAINTMAANGAEPSDMSRAFMAALEQHEQSKRAGNTRETFTHGRREAKN